MTAMMTTRAQAKTPHFLNASNLWAMSSNDDELGRHRDTRRLSLKMFRRTVVSRKFHPPALALACCTA
jgi:hypothetical protein